MLSDLIWSQWAFLLGGSLLVGMAKNGIPGIGILTVPMVVLALPAKEAMGVLLPLLIAGDALAILNYRRHADWRKIYKLAPWVLAGLLAAWWTLDQLNSDELQFWLGVILLLLVILELLRTRLSVDHIVQHPSYSILLGILAGFSSTLANLAGPVMSIYLLSMGLDKHRFVGTAAWFFFALNISKLPIYVQQGMIHRDSLILDLWILPSIGIGAWLGVLLLPRIPQRLFNRLILVGAALSAVLLLSK
jgi:uncharacterized membrane protein YfcA